MNENVLKKCKRNPAEQEPHTWQDHLYNSEKQVWS